MKIGTKSVLFGAHMFFVHPVVLFFAWWKLYGFPWDPRLWVAFIVHDIGYIGKPNMDGPEGEEHPFLGARIMGFLFDWPREKMIIETTEYLDVTVDNYFTRPNNKWYDFCAYHSRFLAKRDGVNPSRLCIADKMAIALTPSWLFVPFVRLTGEVKEYRRLAETGAYTNRAGVDDWDWHAGVKEYCYKYALDHRHDQTDNITVARKHD